MKFESWNRKWSVIIALIGLALVISACGGMAATDTGSAAVEEEPLAQEAGGAAESAAGENKAADRAAEEPALEEAEAPAEGGYGGGGDAAAEVAPMPTAVAAGGEEDIVSVPDEQFEVSLSAGEIDDNADFSAYLQYRLDFLRFLGSTVQVNDIDISERHAIRVTGSDGLPLLGASVLIYDGQDLVTALRTPATGVVYFFPLATLSHSGAGSYSVIVEKDQESAEFTLNREVKDSTWDVQLDTTQNRQRVQLDVLFLIDSTGSMTPQIEQLKDNIDSIAAQIEALPSRPDTRFGMVTYRDRGDVFVSQTYQFTDSVRSFQRDLNGVTAAGGGDTPEAMNEGLHRAIWDVDWRLEDTVSIIILVADAPPHLDYEQDYDYAQEMQSAAEQGIKIFPIMADTGVSGFERDQAEYVLRQVAHFTGGHFIFITSADTPKSTGEEGTDLGVQEDAYRVENLDALVVRLIQDELNALFGEQ